MLKDLLQLRTNQNGLHQFAKNPKRRAVGDDVRHADAAVDLFQSVLVMPNGIRTEALLVDEELAWLYLGDLRDPVSFDTRKRVDVVTDDLTGIGVLPIDLGFDLKTHGLGGDLLQILGTGNEVPQLTSTGRKVLNGLQLKGTWNAFE